MKPESERPPLSIIIVTFRAWELLENNIRHLLDSAGLKSDDPTPWEIIVVDNDADCDRGQAAHFKRKFPQVRVLLAFGDYGYAYGCNCGARVSRGRNLLFMGSDLKAEAEQLDLFLKGLEKYPEYAALTAPQDDRHGRLQRSFAPFTRLSNHFSLLRFLQRRLAPGRHPDPRTPPEKLPEIFPVEWVSGSLVLIRRTALEQIGGWDEEFWLYCEDEDLCRRLHREGLKVGYYTPPRFVHIHAVSTRGTVDETALYKSETVLSKQLYLLKHEPNRSGRLLARIIRLQTTLSLPVFSVLCAVTGGKVRSLELKKKIHRRLRSYYRESDRTGNPLSDHSVEHPRNEPKPVQELSPT